MTGAHTDSEYICIFNVKKALNIKKHCKSFSCDECSDL